MPDQSWRPLSEPEYSPLPPPASGTPDVSAASQEALKEMGLLRAIALRPAIAEDLEFLRRLREATMRDVVLRHQAWVDDEQESRVLAGFEVAQIVQSGDANIGMLKVIQAEDHVRLLQIQLLPGYQGRGIGSYLIGKIQRDSEATEKPVVLHVYRTNRAMTLYARLGFEVVEHSEHSVMMRWDPKKRNKSARRVTENETNGGLTEGRIARGPGTGVPDGRMAGWPGTEGQTTD